jgi:hypothetical protein
MAGRRRIDESGIYDIDSAEVLPACENVLSAAPRAISARAEQTAGVIHLIKARFIIATAAWLDGGERARK